MQSVPTRRGFLVSVAGSMVLAGLPRIARCNATENNSGFHIGIQSYTLRKFDVHQALRMMATLGFETVEFFESHFSVKSTQNQIHDILTAADKLRVKILGHGVDPFTKDHQSNRRYFEFAKAAGVKNITCDPTEDAFDSLDKLVAEYQIRVAIHNHGPDSRYDKINSVLDVVKGRHPMIGACADLGHYIRSGEDPVQAIRAFKGRLFGVHLKDYDAAKKDAKGMILGRGLLPVPAVFKALREVDFPSDGCLSLEYEEHADDPIDDVKQCLAVAKEAAMDTK